MLLGAWMGGALPARGAPETPELPGAGAPPVDFFGAPMPVEEAPPDPVLATRYTGRVIAQRSLDAPRGGLPEESLEPLLRVQQDGRYDPQDVRRDISLLYQLGDFAQVEVEVEPAVAFDAEGQPQPAVTVVYRVLPPLRLEQVDVVGARALNRRKVLAALGLDRGDAWHAEEAPGRAERLQAAYRAAGWPEARVRLTPEAGAEDGLVLLRVEVEEGEPSRVSEIRVRATEALGGRQARWLLARRGVTAGGVVTPAELAAARELLLATVRRDGWYEARVALEIGEGAVLAVLVDPGRRWEIRREGADLPREDEVVEALGLTRGARFGPSWDRDATRALTEAVVAQGYMAAELEVSHEDKAESVRVTVRGARGPRHRLGEVRFRGAEGEADRVWEDRYLQGAFREAAAESVQRRRLTQAAVDAALVAMEEFYRAQGYLSVELTRAGLATGPGRRAVKVDVDVDVVTGPRTFLRSVRVVDAAPEIDGEAPFADLVGQPLNPALVDARTRKLVDAHADRGFLDADATPRITLSGDAAEADLVVEVRPGPVVYLRSVLVKGYARTRRRVIEREVDVVPGEPLSAAELEEIRRRLYDVGVFNRVEVETRGDEDRVKDILITVDEKRNLAFEAGGGIATDIGAKVFLRAGHRNLFGLGHRLTTYGQVGIGWVGDGWTPDLTQPEWRAAARYEAAHLTTRSERLAVDLLFHEQQQERFFRLQRSGGGLGLLLRLGESGRAELGYRIQARQLMDIDPGALVLGDPWLDELSLRTLDDPAPRLPSATRLQSGLGLGLVLDLRDDPYNARTGGVGALNIDLADRLLTDVSYLRVDGSWTQHVPVGGLSLLLRGRGGAALVPEGDATLPLEDRFRLGGGASFRGFEIDAMGPANLVPQESLPFPDSLAPMIDYATRGSPARWVPTGGDALGVATAEVWLPFERLGFDSLEGTNLALFADVGNVWFLSDAVEVGSRGAGVDPWVRWSVGVGLRRSTPVGPVQIDLGFNPQRITDRGETLARVHLSLGAL